MEEVNIIQSAIDWVQGNTGTTTFIGALVTFLTGTGIFALKRRVHESDKSRPQYFADKQLLSPPMRRPAYSDRMAYVLAELSDMAYLQFEGRSKAVQTAAKNITQVNLDDVDSVAEFLDTFGQMLMSGDGLSVEFLEKLLKKSKFELIGTVDVNETQGFACKRVAVDEPNYVVIAFRGTEKKVQDWLTDARAKPTEDGLTKVHTGFLRAFTEKDKKTEDGPSAEAVVKKIIDSDATKDADGQPLPLFITGHSLGGALALMATKLLVPDVNGACYTFGAPRIANYEYFRRIKTPVFRIVNSSDIVPRVPPGAGMLILTSLTKMLSWATKLTPGVSALFDKLESWLDALNGYRHYGDLRYLTDVASGRFRDVRLLSNPPAIDRAIWMWHHLMSSFFVTIKSHSMTIYRKKLQHVANARNAKG